MEGQSCEKARAEHLSTQLEQVTRPRRSCAGGISGQAELGRQWLPQAVLGRWACRLGISALFPNLCQDWKGCRWHLEGDNCTHPHWDQGREERRTGPPGQ